MKAKLRELAELVDGKLIGNGEIEIQSARPLSEAKPGDISFLESDKHAHLLSQSQASALVVPAGAPLNGLSYIQVSDPLQAFVAIVRHLHGRAEPAARGVDPRADIDPSVAIGEHPSVYPFASIGEGTQIGSCCRIYPGVAIGRFCRLGDNVTLYPNVVLYDGTILGNRVTVHANAVIGADGFGYRLQNGKHVKVPQFGHVEIGDDVEIGACTTIDRGTFQATTVGDGTKIDNLVQVGHNCHVGRHNLFVSQMGMAGSSSTGDYVVLAGQVGVVDHVHIGERTVVGGKAAVTKDVPPGQRLLGAPATPERDQKRMLMSLERLPEMRRDVRRILQHLGMSEEQSR